MDPSMAWFKLYCVASSANLVPCRLVESPFKHSEFQTLKPPIYIAIVGQQSLILKLAPSLVYHGLIRALLSLALNCFLLLLFEQRKLLIALTWGVTKRPQAPPCHLQQCM